MNATLKRTIDANGCTLGVFELSNIHGKILFSCHSLELPYLANVKSISAIPVGRYKCVKINSPKFGNVFHVLDVPDRSEILIHAGNFVRDTHGCVLLGLRVNHSTTSPVTWISESRKALNKFMSLTISTIYLEII